MAITSNEITPSGLKMPDNVGEWAFDSLRDYVIGRLGAGCFGILIYIIWLGVKCNYRVYLALFRYLAIYATLTFVASP